MLKQSVFCTKKKQSKERKLQNTHIHAHTHRHSLCIEKRYVYSVSYDKHTFNVHMYTMCIFKDKKKKWFVCDLKIENCQLTFSLKRSLT